MGVSSRSLDEPTRPGPPLGAGLPQDQKNRWFHARGLSNWMVWPAGVSLGVLLCPMVVLLGALFWKAANSSPRVARRLVFWGIGIFFALMNATKIPQGDWAWYLTYYKLATHTPFNNLMQSGNLSIRPTEPIYYGLSYIIGFIFNHNIYIFAIVITLLIYIPYACGLEKTFENFDLNPQMAMAVMILALIAGITFTLSTQLIRQYLAGTLVFLFIAQLLRKHDFAAFVTASIAFLTHNSAIIPVVFAYFAFTATRWEFIRRNFFKIIILMLGVGWVASRAMVPLATAFSQSSLKNDGNISPLVCLGDVILFYAISWAHNHNATENQRDLLRPILFYLSMMAALLLALHQLPLLLLRFYFYFEWMRVFGFISIIMIFSKKMHARQFLYAALVLSLSVFLLRLRQSPWDYQGGFFEHLFRPMAWWDSHLN
jgi:hypothetical protein